MVKSVGKIGKRILEALDSTDDKQMTVTEICDSTGCSRNSAYLNLKHLADGGYVRKHWGKGNSMRYKLVTMKPRSGQPKTVSSPAANPEYSREIDPKALHALLQRWAEQPWKPRVFKTYRNVPHVLSRLYTLAFESATGSPIDQLTINEQRELLKDFQADLISTLQTVNGILDATPLWKSKEFAAWLLSTGGSPVDYNKTALEVKDKNAN
jgi:hypothetical protein